MKISLISLLLCLFSILNSYAQQLSVFTQYREYQGIINPAAVSSDYFSFEHNFSAGVSHRLQWANFDGAPNTSLMRGEYIIDTGGAFSLLTGGHILSDQIGPTGNLGVYGRIAGILTKKNDYASNGGLVLGLTVGAAQFRIRSSNIELVDPTDDLTKNNQFKIYPDVGAGIYFYHRFDRGFFRNDNFYAGISVPQLFGLDLTFTNSNGKYTVKRVPHFYSMLGFYKYFGDRSFFEPSIWVGYVEGAPIQIDLNFRVQWKRAFWVGVGASNSSTAHFEVGFIIGENFADDKHIKIGFGYDHTFSTFGPFAGPTYEFNIAYTFSDE